MPGKTSKGSAWRIWQDDDDDDDDDHDYDDDDDDDKASGSQWPIRD